MNFLFAENLIMVARQERFLLKLRHRLQVLTPIETLKLLKDGKSIARFGDGEFSIMFSKKSIGFQNYNENLSRDLSKVFFEHNNKYLVGIPYNYKSFRGGKKDNIKWLKKWLIECENAERLYEIFSTVDKSKIVFADSVFSRAYFSYEMSFIGNDYFDKVKELWRSRNILLVEGEETRYGVGNDLLDSAKSVRRILVPPTNAYDYINLIKESIIRNYKNGDLVLCAVGPTATVLAAELSKECNIQVIDVGHLDMEYECYSKNIDKTMIKNKYINEVPNGNIVEACIDEKYLASIIAHIGNDYAH